MSGDSRSILTEAQRSEAWRNLGTLARTATGARELVQSDPARTVETLLIDIAAMEALLSRMRRTLSCPQVPK